MARSFWAWLMRRRSSSATAPKGQRRGRHHKTQPALELLETRDCPSATFSPTYVILPHKGNVTPLSTAGPTGTTPTQIKAAYGFNQISFNNGTIAGDGSGTTIAIVDAYDDPHIAGDLQQFDAKFGLPNPVFTKVNQSGGSTMPAANKGWSSEIALDVEWSHAIAPGANILLVEANDSSETNLFAAVAFAADQSNVVAVSMSWGGGEFSGEASSDGTFKTPAGHIGVTFVNSSGDSGAPTSYPATSPNVLSVGGTTLNLTSSGGIVSESAWSGSGGGISADESQPSYQKGVVTQSTTKRANPDVSYDADPNTGFPVYDTENNSTSAPWSQFGGTSDAAPQWAALIAIADEGRIKAGLSSLDGASQTLPMLYGLPATDFHDTTTGTTTGNPRESAGPGYDLATGRGTPVANLIVAALAGQTVTPVSGATHFSETSAPTTITAGGAVNLTVTALDANGNPVTSYTGAVHFTSSDASASLPANYQFTATDKGVHVFSVNLFTAGSQGITATDISNSAITGTSSVAVAAGTANAVVFGQQPSNTLAGAGISPSVTVRIVDKYGNVLTGDSTDQVTVTIGTNPSSGALSGTATVTVKGGVATFSTLSINNAGNGYTLSASLGSLTATSASFNITATSSGGGGGTSGPGTVIEGFETSDMWNVVNGRRITAVLSTAAAHDGNYGLDQTGGNEWIYRSDSAAQIQAGDTISVWLEFANSADGRAYLAFGSSSNGTLSLVAAPNTGQLILQENLNYGFTNLAAVNQTYQANHWYRLQVQWGTSGAIIGQLYDSNGTTVLATVNAATTAITSGGFGFRAIGSDKYWDTVTASYAVNNFAVHTSVSQGNSASTNGATSGTSPSAGSGNQCPSSASSAAASQPAVSQIPGYSPQSSATSGWSQGFVSPWGLASPWADPWAQGFWW